jgi:dihydroxy-acid dehydratase
LLALIEELDLAHPVTLEAFERLNSGIPFIADIQPGGQHPMEAFHQAGGVPAVMNQIALHLDLDVQTVAYEALREQLAEHPVKNPDVIHPVTRPICEAGLVILRGNLADSSVTRPMVVGGTRRFFRGPANVFDSLESAIEGVKAGKLKKGEALVLRYEGPRGGPGCTDIFGLMGYVGGAGLDADCAVITDGKASGFCEGFYVVQVSPEAYIGGPLAIVQNGDMIDIDISSGRLNVDIAPSELERRMKDWVQPEPRIKRGFLTVYHRLALPVERGGGIDLRL